MSDESCSCGCNTTPATSTPNQSTDDCTCGCGPTAEKEPKEAEVA